MYVTLSSGRIIGAIQGNIRAFARKKSFPIADTATKLSLLCCFIYVTFRMSEIQNLFTT